VSRRRLLAAYLGLAVLFLAAARPLEAGLARMRQAGGLTAYSAAPTRAGAATGAFVRCLGGLRGILADLLWMRALRMEETGRYYEIVALLDGLLETQPHFTSVWAFQAYVLAFDFGSLSVDPDPDEAFRWIQRGVGVLERGIERNPTSAVLEEHLALIYMKKFTSFTPSPDWDWKGMARRLDPEGRDLYAGLRLARRHFLLAAEKTGISENRKLLWRRMAVYCLERMGDWATAEREWKELHDRRDPQIDPGDATGTFFRKFMRSLVCEQLLLGRPQESRGAFRRMQAYFPEAAQDYREFLAGEVRAWHERGEERRARELHRALRAVEPAETRSYEEMIGPAAAKGGRPGPKPD
jgi:tetratricopeptide (TPR) repeat protein